MEWMEKRQERNVMLEGKFTFSEPSPLEKPAGVTKQSEITLIDIKDVRFSYDPEKLPFIFDTPISYQVKVGTRVGIIG